MCSDVMNVRKTEAKCTSPCILYKDWKSLGRLHDNIATSHYLLQYVEHCPLVFSELPGYSGRRHTRQSHYKFRQAITTIDQKCYPGNARACLSLEPPVAPPLCVYLLSASTSDKLS